MREIWLSNLEGKVPTVNQLELAAANMGYNRVDGLYYGLKVNGNVKKVICLGESISPGTTLPDKYYRHTQNMPDTFWNVSHYMNKYPAVTVIDTSGTEHEGEIHHLDQNHLTITFSAAFAGYADLN
jgi:hypothetical protein